MWFGKTYISGTNWVRGSAFSHINFRKSKYRSRISNEKCVHTEMCSVVKYTHFRYLF